MIPAMLTVLLALAASAEAAPVDLGGLSYEIVDVTDVQIGVGGVRASVVLELTRTGWPALILRGADFDLIVSGETVGRATASERVRLARGAPERVAVDCELSASESLGAALGGLRGGEGISFVMRGEVAGRIWIIPKTYEVESALISL